LNDRDEEEVRGYRDALQLIHEKAGEVSVSEKTILKFYKLSCGQIWDAGCARRSGKSTLMIMETSGWMMFYA